MLYYKGSSLNDGSDIKMVWAIFEPRSISNLVDVCERWLSRVNVGVNDRSYTEANFWTSSVILWHTLASLVRFHWQIIIIFAW